jgi:hypothetical protein
VSLRTPSSSRSPGHDPPPHNLVPRVPLARFVGLKHRQLARQVGVIITTMRIRRTSSTKLVYHNSCWLIQPTRRIKQPDGSATRRVHWSNPRWIQFPSCTRTRRLTARRTGSRRASGHCVSRRDYSSSGLHRLYCAYAVHPDAPSRRSTCSRVK